MAWANKEVRNNYQRRYRITKGIQPRAPYVAPPCALCGAPVPRSNRRYCSAACLYKDTRERWIAAWLAGEFNPPHGGEGKVPDYIKRWWFATYGEQCVACGWATRRPRDGRIPRTWDHIDGDCSNNRRDNLRLLCPSCHALTDTYGSFNKLSRRKRCGLHNGRTKPKIDQ